MSSQQLSFSLRVSSSVKTVHLLGSWDNYVGQLPLSKDKSSSKSGSWKGTFKFQNSTLEPGQRYWYYYIIDGYHVAHNPSEKSTTEPTTGRDLNILDVPNGSSKHSSSSSSSRHHSSDHHRSSRSSRKSLTVDIPKGRPLSTSQIKAPKPVSPTATKKILESEYRYYDDDEIADLTARFGYAVIDEDDIVTNFSNSPMSSSGSSLSSYESDSSAGSPSSSLSGYSTPGSDLSSCTCERYGITRKGERVKIDCRGQYCGYEDSSDCSSEGGYDDRYDSPVSHGSSRRNGIVVT
ncbi:hypothetical protein CC79DRAFT_1277488 [Sarocladium strictum]